MNVIKILDIKRTLEINPVKDFPQQHINALRPFRMILMGFYPNDLIAYFDSTKWSLQIKGHFRM